MPQVRALFTDVADFQAAALGMRFDVANMLASEWVQQYHMVFAQPAMDTTISDLQTLIAQAQNNGWTIDEISKQIDATFDYYLTGEEVGALWREIMTEQEFQWFLDRKPRPRRDLIARTETMRASNAGTYNLYMESGEVELKEWLAAHDRRTRDTHVQADATYREGGSIGPIPMDQPFIVGGFQMMYPLDGSMGADISEMANCRCTMAPVLYEFEEEEPQPEQALQEEGEFPSQDQVPLEQTPEWIRDELIQRDLELSVPISEAEIEHRRARRTMKALESAVENVHIRLQEGVITREEYEKEKADFWAAVAEEQRLRKRIKDLTAMRDAELRKMLFVPEEYRNFVPEYSATQEIRDRYVQSQAIEDAAEWYRNMQGVNVLTGADPVKFEAAGDKDRANHSNGTIRLKSYSETATIVHEWGHEIEEKNPRIEQMAVDFLERRTANDQLERLKDIYPDRNYKDYEVAKKDKFMNAYMGRIYKVQDTYYGTEIFSMGLQYMYERPAEFAGADPEYFDLIYKALRGWD